MAQNNKIRISNLELLRIVSMLMIIAHHYILYGVMQHYDDDLKTIVYTSGTAFNKIIAQFILPGGVIGVGAFFTIMGYFGIDTEKIKISKTVEKTIFYSVFGLLIYIVTVNDFECKKMLIYLTPICNSSYWFISVYAILSLMKPVLNHSAEKINGIGKRKFVIICSAVLTYYLFARFNESTYLGLVQGALFYIIGALLKFNKQKLTRIHSIGWLAFASVSWCLCVLHCNLDFIGVTRLLNLARDVGNCVWGLCSSISLFMFFNSVKEFKNGIVNTIAKSSFAVYLAHEHPLLRETLYSKVFHVESFQWKSSMFLVYACLTVFCIYIVFGFFDIIIDWSASKLRKPKEHKLSQMQ